MAAHMSKIFQNTLKQKRGKTVNFVYKRNYSSSVLPPLNVPFKDERNRPTNILKSVKSSKVQLTTLSNGIKVASEDSFGQFCTVGVLIDAGSRYEINYQSGVSHLLEKLAFQSTSKYHSKDEITKMLEEYGGHADCQIFRDCSIYAASAFKYNVEGVVDILSEAVLKPIITQDELEEQRRAVEFELESLDYKPDMEAQLTDLIHAAAYCDNTLGLPKLCPTENINKITAETLKHYMRRYYTPDRLTISGVNVDHEELVRWCEKYFIEDASKWGKVGDEPDRSFAQYTGGMLKDHRAEPRLQPGITQLPELVHVALGFESASYTEPEMFTFAVLNLLLGGGGSFSAGGPGKGMYSRLYTNVLNRRHWMFSSAAFNHSYADTGLIYIHSSANPAQTKDMVSVMVQEYRRLVSEPFHEIEVARAKKQTQSMLMMNLESRVVRFEDIGRQILGLGYHKSSEELYDSIESVTSKDLKEICEKMLSTRLSVAAIGNLVNMPKYEDIEKQFNSRHFGSRLFSAIR